MQTRCGVLLDDEGRFAARRLANFAGWLTRLREIAFGFVLLS
jgi:hypothetical protein